MDYIKILKGKKVEIGALYLFEGELMKVIIKHPEDYKAGDDIACLYSGVTFKSKILKKSQNHIYILVPQFYEQLPTDKRKHPRISVDFPGEIYHRSKKLVDVKIIDISRNGLGIKTNHNIPSLQVEESYEIKVDLVNSSLTVIVMIRNFFEADEKRYGCEIKSIDKKSEYELRKFILSEQLSTNMRQSKEQ